MQDSGIRDPLNAGERRTMKNPDPPVRERLLASGTALFAERGFEGASVRKICRDAATSINMIHHYFGSKEGLLEAILEQYDTRVFAVPMRLLETAPKSKEDFVNRLEMLFETTLEAYIEQRSVIMVAVREQTDLAALAAYQRRFVAFLEQAKKIDVVRKEIDSALITGAMLDRILNQVLFAPWIKRTSGADVLTSPRYRQSWSRANVDLLLHGFLRP
ncbi:MAG: TetR/AcrR family transcriptional regulator [Alphaproteobacteria bacterium]